MLKQKSKIIIKIHSSGITQRRNINKSNKQFYDYNRKIKAWIKKSKIEIKKIKFVIVSKRKEKFKTKKVKKEIKIKKEKLLTKKAKKIEKKIKEVEKEKPLPVGHRTEVYDFICCVSDRTIQHKFGARSESVEEFGIEVLHNDNYPDHVVLDFKFSSDFFVEDKGITYSDSATEKQKDFMRDLGIDEEDISILNKKLASKVISKYRK